MQTKRSCSAALASTLLVTAILLSGCATTPPATSNETVRIASFNAALSFNGAGGLVQALTGGEHEAARKAAAIIQHIAPDILVLNEFDYAPNGAGRELFRTQYLARSQFGQDPINYPYVYTAPVNTGVSSGADLDGDGKVSVPQDAHGWGEFAGQYGMLVLSQFPLGGPRTFQEFRWADLPKPSWPRNPGSGQPYYSDQAMAALRLSSKSHWDLPIIIGQTKLHLLVSHPTPPVFDGPENRNGLRNSDEIQFWIDYIAGADYPYDDNGQRGGLDTDAKFVLAGDLNADPNDGDGNHQTINRLLRHPRINHGVSPKSDGAIEAARWQAGANILHRGHAALDTSDFEDQRAGNLRIDYVLPSANLTLVNSGVFWPRFRQLGADWVSGSDHRLVWADVELEQPIETQSSARQSDGTAPAYRVSKND